jgi:hypothetical protein
MKKAREKEAKNDDQPKELPDQEGNLVKLSVDNSFKDIEFFIPKSRNYHN